MFVRYFLILSLLLQPLAAMGSSCAGSPPERACCAQVCGCEAGCDCCAEAPVLPPAPCGYHDVAPLPRADLDLPRDPGVLVLRSSRPLACARQMPGTRPEPPARARSVLCIWQT